MPLVKCPDCQTEVSDRAPSCPKCGAPINHSQAAVNPQPAPKKKTSFVTWGCLTLIVLAVLGGIINKMTGVDQPPPPAPVDQKQEQAVKIALVGAGMLKKGMRDPDSFKLRQVLVMDTTNAVCYDYNARNGFGGYNHGQAVLSPDLKNFKTSEQDGFRQLWNKWCGDKKGTDVTNRLILY
jgi:hypothetical protein